MTSATTRREARHDMRGVRATPEIRETFLRVLSQTANVMLACKAVGHSREWAYNERARYPEFAAAWDDAKRAATDVLRKAAWERAVGGWKEEVYTPKGDLAGYVRRYDGRLLQFLLIHADPEEFGIHKDITVHADHRIVPSLEGAKLVRELLSHVGEDAAAREAIAKAFMTLSQEQQRTVDALPLPPAAGEGEPGRRAKSARPVRPAQQKRSQWDPVDDYSDS